LPGEVHLEARHTATVNPTKERSYSKQVVILHLSLGEAAGRNDKWKMKDTLKDVAGISPALGVF
jgi:hypothetical protein